jgi:CTP synthase (UTP-ammonia lyase)
MKYVLVTGGVVSGLGKGVTASSIGVLLKNCGLRVTSIKIGEYSAIESVEWGWRPHAKRLRRPRLQTPI